MNYEGIALACKRPWFWVLLAASILTLVDVIKPMHIDDTAYFYYAQQVYQHPSDPYGFSFIWRQRNAPANNEIGPPVLSYWWSLAMHLFGYTPWLWKLWMFPFALLLCCSSMGLIEQFEIAPKRLFLCLIILSPWILPSMNMMLDVPMLALILSSLFLFMRALAQTSLPLAIAAGLVLGAAMETKYSALAFPGVLLAWAITMSEERICTRFMLWFVTTGIALGIFVAYEYWTAELYGVSHFMRKFQLTQHVFDRHLLVAALPKLLGGTAPFLLMAALMVLGLPIYWLLGVAGLLVIQYSMFFIPSWFGLNDPAIPILISKTCHDALGAGVLVALALMIVRVMRKPEWRLDRVAIFLILWLCVEIAGYFIMSPFAAARRIFGISIVTSFLIGRLAFLNGKQDSESSCLLRYIVIGQAALSSLFCYVDYLDAAAQKDVAYRAFDQIHAVEPGGSVWFAGHWGFQFYAQQVGMMPILPRESVIRQGDYFIVPHDIVAQEIGAPRAVQKIANIKAVDNVPFKMRKAYYGGTTTMDYKAEDRPRFQVDIFRANQLFVP